METSFASALQYALWPGLTLAMLALWVAAVLDIDRHRRRGSSTNARLACMACCVSVALIAAVAWSGALFAPGWAEAISSTEPGAIQDARLEEDGAPPTSIFSFGLERAPSSPRTPELDPKDR